MVRKAWMVVAFCVLGALAPDVAAAGGAYGFRSWGLSYPTYGLAGWGWGTVYGYPLDDSFDPPVGYGEYAQYGPWAYGGCFEMRRRVATPYGWRWRQVQVCK